jgi:hypothetical protein
MRALEYRDIELYALRDSEYPGGVKLGMLVQLRLLKGRRNRDNPSVSQPRWINLTTHESSLDLRSNLPSAGTLQASISSKSSWDSRSGTRPLPASGSVIPRDVWAVAIPDRLQSVPIEWAQEWKNVPVLRRSVRDTTGKVYTSPTLASQFHQMSTWNRRLGRSFGMKEAFEFKMLRQGAAAALPGKSLPWA